VERGLNDPLIFVRAVHFIATMMVGGAVLFAAFIAEPAFRKTSGVGRFVAKIRHLVARIWWTSLVLAVISGAGWLVLTTEEISDRPLADVFSKGVIWTVLAHTRFGHIWLVRLVLAGTLAGMLSWAPPRQRIKSRRIGAVVIAAGLVGTLAWAGHAAATPGIEGSVHLTADVLHLIAAAAWVGALVPLALLLRTAWREDDETSRAVAQSAVLRFSTLGIASVATLLATGFVNSWILTGTIPALVGTDYGRLLLVKVALFLVMVSIAAVNRLWLTPRLVREPSIAGARNALRQLGRNSAFEAATGAIILGIVAVLGTTPPGLHQQATWPFSIRVDTTALGDPGVRAALFGALGAIACGAALIVAGFVVRRFRWPAIAAGCIIIYFAPALRLPTIKAYPTTFYASPTGFSVQSIADGESLFEMHCASCHGPQGRGDGPAGGSLKTKPADLTADHVYGHSDGDLFWRITHGIEPGMPEFRAVLDEDARWSLIDFIRANADAVRLRVFGAGTDAAFPAPNFSAECRDGSTISIDQLRAKVVHIVVAGSHSDDWLGEVVDRDVTDALRTIVIATDPGAATSRSLCVTHDPDTITTFALYRGDAEPLEGTEFLVDPAGNLRTMWRSDDVSIGRDADALERRIEGLRIDPRVARSAGSHAHMH
jgi:putative copper resistance protein D